MNRIEKMAEATHWKNTQRLWHRRERKMFGSVQNRLMERSEQPTPEIGMGVTRTSWSDRHPYSVVKIINDRTIVVQEDKAIRTDKNGMSEVQTYTYEPDPDGRLVTLTLRKNGRWVMKGTSTKNGGGTGWCLGHRDRHYDYSF